MWSATDNEESCPLTKLDDDLQLHVLRVVRAADVDEGTSFLVFMHITDCQWNKLISSDT